jgi:O-antigen/teichoic acid export membrane protein
LTKPAIMLREVLFPDLTRMHYAESEGFHKLGFQAMKAAALVGTLLVLISIPAGGPILGLIGPEYTAGAVLLSLMLLAATFELSAAPLRAAAYALGRVGRVLKIHVISILVYLGLFYLLTPLFGLPGPGIAAVIGAVLTLALMLRLIRQTA